MNQILDGITQEFEIFLLILIRMAGLFLMSPVFGRQNLPVYSKLGLSLFLSYMVFINRFFTIGMEINSFYGFGLLIFREVLIGYVMGFVTTLIFSAIWTAGQLIDTQIGFGIVNVIDPNSSIQVPLMGNFKNIIALLAFFTMDGHHTLVKLIFSSYDIIPLGEAIRIESVTTMIVRFFVNSFVLALKIAVPIIAITFLSEVAFGILIRTVPQMNIFIIGIPVKIFIGLIAILVFIPIYISSLNGIFDGMFRNIGRAIKVLEP